MYAYAVTGRYRETLSPPHAAGEPVWEADEMSNITQEYLVLFRAVTEAEQALEELRNRMIEAQQLAEEIYISRDETS